MWTNYVGSIILAEIKQSAEVWNRRWEMKSIAAEQRGHTLIVLEVPQRIHANCAEAADHAITKMCNDRETELPKLFLFSLPVTVLGLQSVDQTKTHMLEPFIKWLTIDKKIEMYTWRMELNRGEYPWYHIITNDEIPGAEVTAKWQELQTLALPYLTIPH